MGIHETKTSKSSDSSALRVDVLRLVDRLRAIGPVGDIEKREPVDLPERPGLI